jgi:hypothetical protein
MSFLRHKRSIARWDLQAGTRAKQVAAPPPPSHRLNESQPVIPRQVALLQSLLPLHQPVSSSRQSAGNVNLHPIQVEDFSTGEMRNFQPALTASFVEGSSHRRRGGGSTGLDCSAAGADFLPRASPNVRTCEGARPDDSMFHFEKGSSIESSECGAVPSFCADLSRMLVAKLPVPIRHRSMIRASPI